MQSDSIISGALIVLGVGFLAANLRILVDFVRFFRRRASALLTWPSRKPPLFGLLLAIGVVLGLLIAYKLVMLRRPLASVFGEGMMFAYYAYLYPLSLRVGRGLYADGIWADSLFIPYSRIGGLTWREEPEPSLIIIYRSRPIARRLTVPQQHYGEVRRLLREKIAGHDIHFTGKTLDLGAHDERDDV